MLNVWKQPLSFFIWLAALVFMIFRRGALLGAWLLLCLSGVAEPWEKAARSGPGPMLLFTLMLKSIFKTKNYIKY
jgi:hypothetical protein